MGLIAENTQHVELAFVGLRQISAATDPHHLRASLLSLAFFARYVGQVLWLLGVTHINNRRAVVFKLLSQRVDLFVTMVTHIGNPATALLLNNGLISGTPLQVVVTDKTHVAGFGFRCFNCRCR